MTDREKDFCSLHAELVARGIETNKAADVALSLLDRQKSQPGQPVPQLADLIKSDFPNLSLTKEHGMEVKTK